MTLFTSGVPQLGLQDLVENQLSDIPQGVPDCERA